MVFWAEKQAVLPVNQFYADASFIAQIYGF